MSRPVNINVSNTLVTTQAAQTHSKTGTIYSYYPSHTAPRADNHFATHPEDYKSSSFGKPTHSLALHFSIVDYAIILRTIFFAAIVGIIRCV